MEERQDTQQQTAAPVQQLTTSAASSPAAANGSALQEFQGVLWKRRDVFKNKWRPRWFVLQPEEAVLTYYLLSRQDAGGASTISTPLRKRNNNNNGSASAANSTAAYGNGAASNGNNGSALPPITRQFTNNNNGNNSMHSGVSELTNDMASVSENPVDYDVVPRGAIYLAGCRVAVNDSLSIPEDGLFALTIVPPQASENECHLAARTEEARSAWVATLAAACQGEEGTGAETETASGDTDQRVAVAAAPSSSSWKSQSPAETLFDNVPTPLAARLEQSLETHLELCQDDGTLQWTPIFQNRNGMSAYQRQDLHGRVLMKCTATIPHHPKQILNLLLDKDRRNKFEFGVSVSERLEVLNHFTYLDYYAYKAVWPLSARDFAVAVHWQVLHRQLAGGETITTTDGEEDDNQRSQEHEAAIAIMAFSCPEASALKEANSSNVRGTLHCSFTLLQLVPATTASDEPRCNLTRIMSYDLGGQIPKNLAKTVLMQQAGLPLVISEHLRFVEPTPEDRLMANDEGMLMTNEEVIKDVVEALVAKEDSAVVSSARRKLSFDNTTTENGASNNKSNADTPEAESNALSPPPTIADLSTPRIAAVLLSPLLLYQCLSSTWLTSTLGISEIWLVHPSLLFVCTAFLATRYIVLRSLGPELPAHKSRQIQLYEGGPVTCEVTVDLKGVLRFVSMKKEELKEQAQASNQGPGGNEVSVVHIVAFALAKAMKQNTNCWKLRRVNFPSLLIDGCYEYPSAILDLAVSTTAGQLLSLENFQYNNVQDMANALASKEEVQQEDLQSPTDWMTHALESLCAVASSSMAPKHGRCMVVLAESDSHGEGSGTNDAGAIDMTVGRLPADLDVLVIVGGIRLQRKELPVGSPARTTPPKPVLSLAVTINTASVLDIAKCRTFVEDLRKLVQFPELLED